MKNTNQSENNLEVAVFPVEIFPQIVQQYLAECTKAINCPLDFIATPVLVTVAMVIGNSFQAVIKKGWGEKPIIFMAIIGSTGTKKTPAIKKGLIPLYEIQKLINQDNSNNTDPISIMDSITLEGNGNKNEIKQIITTDATMEALARLFLVNPHGILLSKEELIGLWKSFNQYKGGKGDDMEKYLSLWTGENIIINRVGSPPLIVNNPFICICGGIQNEVMEPIFHTIDNGMKERFLFVFPESIRHKHSDDEISDATSEAFINLMEKIHQKLSVKSQDKDAPFDVSFSKEGKAEWKEWHIKHLEEMNGSIPYYLVGSWSKMVAYFIRFSLLMEVLKTEGDVEKISLESVQNAKILTEYFKDHARKIYDIEHSGAAEKTITRAVEWIRLKGGRVTLREIYSNRVAKCKNANDAEELFRELTLRQLGYISPTTPPNGGKPILVFSLKREYLIKTDQK